jgi:hypothetical protein
MARGVIPYNGRVVRAQEAGIGEIVGGGEVRELDLDQVRNINRFEGLFGGGGEEVDFGHLVIAGKLSVSRRR